MLSFFPNPYPDEILYSVFARYHIRSGNISPKITMKELFGSSSVTASVDFPSNLDNLINNLLNFNTISVEQLVYKNTLYPLYAPFIPEQRAELIYKSMRENNGGDISTRAGIMASNIKYSRFLRLCPKCFEVDKIIYGEPYWHRLHQIPGVIICPDHNSFILNSKVVWHGFNKHEFIAASEDNCKKYIFEIVFSNEELKKLHLISENIKFLINSKLKSKDFEWFHEKYINMLINKGYASPKGRIYQKNLINDFTLYYGGNILKALQSDIDFNENDNWLSGIARKSRKAFNPLRHVLFIKFLDMDIEMFFKEKSNYLPFGSAPWPCLNSASIHYHENVIKNVEITYDTKTKQPVGNFKCDCGFIYSRRGPDKKASDRYRIGRVKEFGSIWMMKLRELSECKDLSFREIARIMNVDTNTVIKYIKNDFQNIKSDDMKNSKEELNVIRNSYRDKWLSLYFNNSDKTKTQLRNIDKATFMWLYRNDVNWLNSIEYKKSDNYLNNRVDWEKRDKEILLTIKGYVEESLKKKGKPERITVSRIGKISGLHALLEKHMDLLPSTKAYFNNVVESVEDFQIRRIHWAVKEIKYSGKPIEKWRILRKAAIHSNCSKKVIETIEHELQADYINKVE